MELRHIAKLSHRLPYQRRIPFFARVWIIQRHYDEYRAGIWAAKFIARYGRMRFSV